MPTAYPGQPAYSPHHGNSGGNVSSIKKPTGSITSGYATPGRPSSYGSGYTYGAGPVAWSPPENMSWDDISVIESEEGVMESGIGGSADIAFNPFATGISGFLLNQWMVRKEVAAQQDGSHDPGVKKFAWDEYLNTRETLSPRDLILGGWEKDYTGALQPTLNPETMPGALGNENAPRSVDTRAPPKDTNITLWEAIQGRAQETADVFSEFKTSGEALGSLINPGSESRKSINTTILLGLGALLLLVLIIK